MMFVDSTVLAEIGLTPGEKGVYMALLRIGPSSIGPLVADTGLQKSTVYFCIEKLLKKGLVSYFTRNNIKVFEAETPNRMLDYLDARQREIARQKLEVNRLMPEFLLQRQESPQAHSAKVFEGWEGLKAAFDDILETLGEGDEYYVLGVTTMPRTKERFRRFIRQFHLKRAQKKIVSRIILNKDLLDTIGRDREEEPYTEARYIEREFMTPAISNIYSGKVLFTIWGPPYGFQLKSGELSLSLRNYFSALWKRAKSRKQLTGEVIKKIVV